MKESNSDLDALLCVSPPSPVLSASAMSVSLTSGTIPIFLDETDGPELGDIPHGVGPGNIILSQLFLLSIERPREDIPEELASIDSQDHQERCIVQDSSSQNSFGTFGPLATQRTSSWCPIDEAGNLIAYMQNEHEDSADPNRGVGPDLRLSEDALGLAVDLLQQETPAPFVHRAADGAAAFTGDLGGNALKLVDPTSLPQEEDLFTYGAGHVQSTQQQEDDWRLYSAQPEDTATQSKRTFKGSQTFSFPAKHRDEASEHPIHSDAQSIVESADGHSEGAPVHRQLYPDTLPWLKDIAVDLLIDQEGFRSVQPIFKLTGYSPQARSLHPEGQECDGGVVEFMPVHTKTYNFHYAPFDSPPILRRVMVNKQESRDYISRQALLSIKDNGVYTVRGVETATFSVPYAKEGSGSLYAHVDCKMRWKFEYLVGNRRLEKTGRFLDGEKTLTPLTFACSPLLLHPKQGKKVKLMYLVRKTVAAKLVAEKMELPARMRGPAAVPHGDWQTHRRAQSHAPQESHTSLSSESSSKGHHRELPRHVEVATNQRRVGRRRASSAGERPRNPGSPLREDISTMQPSPCSGSNLITGRHILPRYQLSELIDSYSACPPLPATNGVTPLTPYRGNKF
ncbi:hypothetical protein BDN71DRAFT_1437926 [Pleurotus eryngii]|uniref:Uncharacterized protein n=1 Tax=Pleurotus eryngii TaxID=5323 RepID=A0A9P6AAF9_PLEER|nr:hypothetical protein BDN71DRAFT_1437926 [Pleurotus eryngii]